MSVTRDEVIWGYRFILGRDPESNEVILEHQNAESITQLREDLLKSNEFQDLNFDAIPQCDLLPPMIIELPNSPEKIDILWKHVQESWEKLGNEIPHFSVITNDEFLPQEFKENEDKFWSTGENDLKMIESTFSRSKLDLANVQSILEFGCGVGRVTTYISKIANEVFAVDISQYHLDIARSHMKKNNIANVKFYNLAKDKFKNIPNADFVYTRLVLQHNSPPLMKELLIELLRKVNRGGSIIFQLPVYMRAYEFKQKEYLAQLENGMEMHCLPQAVIFEILAQENFRLIEVRETDDIGNRGERVSNTFFATRNH